VSVRCVLDTHVWLWWHIAPDRLSPKVAEILSPSQRREGDEFLLSAISTWEFSKLLEKKRLTLTVDPEVFLEKAMAMPGLRLVPITPRIAYRSTQLPQPFHRDPGDQIIVATARDWDVALITKDDLLQKYPFVRTYW
jgi:PIN domain nuclease of toxin-antitoxin system